MPTLAVDERLLETVRGDADEAERERRLTDGTLAGLRDAGVLRALVPASLGGGEAHPREFRCAVEELAAADGAAGWIAAVGATAGLAAAYLPEATAGELFGDEASVPAGVFAPVGRLEPGADGFTLSGRWPLGSGVGGATVVGLGCIHPEGGPRYALVRRADVEIVDTWDSLGLRASASHDVTAEAVAVPADHLIDLIGGRPVAQGPLYAFPLFGLLALAVSAACTGIAAGALADVALAASARRPAGSARTLAERSTTQERVAEATASLRAATAGVDAAIDVAWSRAERGEPLDPADRAGLRLASTHAAQTAVAVVGVCHRLGGARALYRGSTLERRQRDVHTAAQHMIVAPATNELAGRVLLGLDPDITML